jgi:hypothetical protein
MYEQTQLQSCRANKFCRIAILQVRANEHIYRNVRTNTLYRNVRMKTFFCRIVNKHICTLVRIYLLNVVTYIQDCEQTYVQN